MRGARVLVVGGAGFVGSNLVEALLAGECAEIVIVDNLLSAERENVPHDPRVRFIEGSIGDPAVLDLLADDLDDVFHLATFHGNQNSIADPLADHANNVVTTLRLYERLKGFRRLRRVVYAASGCTLAAHTVDTPEPAREDGPVPLDLDSPYQISKLMGELHSVYYHRQHDLPTVRARFQNVYGPREILGAGQWRGTAATVWRNVVPTFIYRALKGLPLRLDDGGAATRDFIFVDDIVDGLILCAARGAPGDVYNLASGVETSIMDLAAAVNELTGNAAPVEFGPRRPWDRAGRRVGSTEKARAALGFEARVPLAEGLARTIKWTRDALPMIEACIARHAGRMSG